MLCENFTLTWNTLRRNMMFDWLYVHNFKRGACYSTCVIQLIFICKQYDSFHSNFVNIQINTYISLNILSELNHGALCSLCCFNCALYLLYWCISLVQGQNLDDLEILFVGETPFCEHCACCWYQKQKRV